MTVRRILTVVAVAILLLGVTAGALAQTRTHTVQPGETLFSIARRYGLTVEQVAAANGITNPALIYAGQVLVIPGGSAPPSSGMGAYVVQPGDTLFSIARRHNTTVEVMIRLNGLTNPDVLAAGQVLVVPGGGTAPTNAPSPTATPANQTIAHTVQRGETLNQIALRYGTTYQQIALLNGLPNPDLIYPGQVLIIRQGTTPPPTTATAIPITTAPTTIPTTAVPTTPPSGTALSTATTAPPTATPTLTPTLTATATPGQPSPTPLVSNATVSPNAPNLLTNPGFEGNVRSVAFPDVNVFANWEPFYCDEPYTAAKCPAPRQGTGNPEGLMMGRPEYQSTTLNKRVHGGSTAQQWFCFWRSCDAGVYQTVNTTAGAVCEVGAYIQSWSANGTGYLSDLQTADQRANSTWFIRVDPTGGTNAFASHVLVSRGFGYADGIYDKYMLIKYVFTTAGPKTTVFFENIRLWPISNNDNFLDDGYVRCNP